MSGVKAQLIQIGSFRGVSLPQSLIEEAGLGEQVILTVENGRVVIAPARPAREGWEEQFRHYAEQSEDDDDFADMDVVSEFDEAEWEWE